jgi:ABC-type transport system involved in multi-copper enzyme maturation permease subunit
MTTRAIKRKREEGPLAGDFQAPQETAPSVLRADQPTASRAIALVALLAASLGAFALILAALGRQTILGTTGGVLCLAVGIAGLLYHAATERDQQYRRIYGIVGAALLVVGVIFRLLPIQGTVGGLFLPAGVPALLLSLFFLLGFVRNETDPFLRTLTVRVLGIAGGIMALIGVLGGLVSDAFLLGQGILLLVLGLTYVAAYVGTQPVGSDRGYWAGLGLGVAGGLMVLIALGYLLLPGLFAWVRWTPGQPGPPFLYFYAGLEYLLLAVGICSDAKLVVMTRRELAAYFYSPIAYIVFVALAVLGCWSFLTFVQLIDAYSTRTPFGMPEPIVRRYVLTLIPVMSMICAVPIITMRLLSEEQRSGTLEVLLTAPVNEWSVVLSKFFAALRFFLLIWYPWGLYLVALRIEGGEEFDYRPLLSFAIVLLVTGAHFVALGVFFSSLTRSQVAAAILTLMGMIALLVIGFFQDLVAEGSAWYTVLTYVSYLNLWSESLQGNLAPRLLLFHLSATVFWLFLTVKVLEARKWR